MACHLISSSESEEEKDVQEALEETHNNYDFKGLLPLYERLQMDKVPESSSKRQRELHLETVSPIKSSPIKCSPAKAKRRKRRTPEEIQEEKSRKEERKKQREDARKEKMAENERKKLIKKAEADVKKSNKATEAVKYITARFDYGLSHLEEFHSLLQLMNAVGVNYSTTSNPVPRSVMWQRTVLLPELDANFKPCSKELELEEEILVIPELSQFLKCVKENTVNGFMEQWPTEGKITLIIWGLEKYLRATGGPQKSKKAKLYEGCLKVTRAEIEAALVELQIEYQCNHRFVERAEDAAEILACFTKAIAECPHKRRRDEQVWDWYADADSFRAVKIDKTGDGIGKLWQQQIRQFTGIGEEIAQAIVGAYPTPAHLMKAYEETSCEKEGMKLIKDIEVRRGVGPLASKRKVGPELSKRLYLLFTDLDGSLLLS